MARPAPDQVRRVAVIGTGLIGGAWAALFLSRGLEVSASDPGPNGEESLRAMIARGWPVLEKLGLAPGADPERFTFNADPVKAVEGCQFVQESAPEKEDVKAALVASLEAGLDPDIVIASSASALLPSKIQTRCKHPERVIVGHPFNPPYLIPLVEVVGGAKTAPETLDWAAAFYTHCGKRALKLKKEIAGFVANRLQGAVYREIINLARMDVASMADIDAAMSQGPGLRWAVMGPSLNFHLARRTGFWDFIDSFPSEFNTYDLADGKTTVDPDTRKRMVDGVVEATGGRTNDAMARERDKAIIDLIATLRGRDLPD